MAAFMFVSSNGRPDQAESKAERRRIRQHAMRSMAIARRERGGYGQHNRRQIPIFIKSTGFEGKESASSQKICQGNHESDDLFVQVISRIPLLPSALGYESARIRYGFDILSLSALTSVYLSRHSVQTLCSSSQQLQRLMRIREPSWLDFVPSQYSESKVLQAAVDCTMAQAHRLLYPDAGTTEAVVIKLYLKALSELQAALCDGERWARPDVLCATQILAFYEFLQFSRSERWLHHIAGMRKLIKLRGSTNYRTELEQQMLMSQTGTIFHESMLLGEDCFFEEPEWKALLSSISAIENSTTVIKTPDCHPMISSLWILASPSPRLFKQTTAFVTGLKASEPGSILQLILEALQTRQNVLSWRKKFTVFASERSADRQRLRLRELLGVSFAVQIVLNRLIVALEPRAAEAKAYEIETQVFADKIIDLCEEAAREALPASDILLAQKLVIAKAAKESEHDWMLAVSRDGAPTEQGKKSVPAAIFQRWCISLMRHDV